MYPADRCWGTRECDPCSCGGDETKCDFYPEKRKAASKKEKNILSKPISFGIREISCRKRMASICVAKSRTICIECSILQLICLKWTMNSLVFAVLGFTMSIVNGAMSR